MRTLLLTRDWPPHPGGMSRLYAELCRRFPVGGVEVSAPANPEGAEAAAAPGVVVHRMPFGFRRARTAFSVAYWTAWTAARVRRAEIDVLQVGNIRPTGYIARVLRRRVPYVIYVHGLDLWSAEREAAASAARRRATAGILGGASAIIANSGAIGELAQHVLRQVGVEPGERVRVVHPGADPARFRPDSPGGGEWRRELGVEGRMVVLTVARLVPRKGVDTMIAALPKIAESFPEVVYVVAGAGRDRERLERLVAAAGMSNRVRFVGSVPESRLAGLYAAADIFALPAREERAEDEIEGFGIVYCEAAAAGLPVVAGDSGGVRDAVRDGETALLVPPEVRPVGEALSRLLGDPALRQRLGEAGRRAVETHYNWERAARAAWAVLEEVAIR